MRTKYQQPLRRAKHARARLRMAALLAVRGGVPLDDAIVVAQKIGAAFCLGIADRAAPPVHAAEVQMLLERFAARQIHWSGI